MLDDEAGQTVDLDAARALATYRNYLAALSTFVHTTYPGPGGHLKRLAQAQQALTGFARLRPQPFNATVVRELLFNAWHTEIVLAIPQVFSDPGLIRFTNQWAPVQAYYAVYSLWRAWFSVQGTGAETHGGVLRSASSTIRQRSPFPPPWSYACSGGYRLGDAEHIGFQSTEISDVNHLSTPAPHLASDDWISKTLRTTRKFFLKDREGKWKREHRTKTGAPYKRIPSKERDRIRNQLHPTTLFDLFYRLRIRSNYRDVDDFVSGQLDDADALTYFQSLLTFTQSTMLLLESMIRAAMPEGGYEGHARQFLRSRQRSKYSGLSRRLIALQAADSGDAPA